MAITLTRQSIVFPILLASLLSARPALAGPPLLCHPFDINGASSLPWGIGPSWFAEMPGYDLSRLVADTEKLLGPDTPVIVRMETLRRASIYASRDQHVAADLLKAVTAKVHDANGAKAPDALRYLDGAYVIEAFRQIGMFNANTQFGDRALRVRGLVKNLDGYSLMQKSVLARPGDPALEFAAALIASQDHRAEYQQHAERARAGASKDPLLARNLSQLM